MTFHMKLQSDLLDMDMPNLSRNDEDDTFEHDIDFGNIPVLTPEEEDILQKLELSGKSTSTLQQTVKWVAKFREFLKSRNLNDKFEEVDDTVLNDYLRLFYASLKQNNGKWYAPSSLICIRAAIHRRLISPEVNRDVDILNGSHFLRANGILKAIVKKYLMSGQEKTEAFNRIVPEDMSKIKEYFATNASSNNVLQQECQFNIILYFQLRGQENLKNLKKDSFGFHIGDGGREYAYLKSDLLQKNVKPSLRLTEFSDYKNARMYEQQNNLSCPIKRLKNYLSLLPDTVKDNTLFPKCLKDGKFSSSSVIGKNYLAQLMSNLSECLHLSKKYTNHCIRVTAINMMHESGLSHEEISFSTGHKHAGSVQRYLRKNDKGLEKAFDALSGTTTSTSSTSKSMSIIQHQEYVCEETTSIVTPTDQPHTSKSISFTAPPKKKCKFQFDGEKNVITIDFL